MSNTVPIPNSDLYHEAIHISQLEQEKNWPLIQELYRETDHLKRRQIYSRVSEPNPELFHLVREIFAERHVFALSQGFNSVLEHTLHAEQDHIHWHNLLLSQVYQDHRRRFAAVYSSSRKAALGRDEFHVWDFWLMNTNELAADPRHISISKTTDSIFEVLHNFLGLIGFAEIYDKIHWIPNEANTVARMEFTKDKVLSASISITESSCHADRGTLAYYSLIAHEIGHVIQAYTNQKPSNSNLAPRLPLREVVSMLLQKLFLSEPVLKYLGSWNKSLTDTILRRVELDDAESLARYLCYLEFEIRLYDLTGQNLFTPEDVSVAWKECHNHYFGFSTSDDDEDHSWQNNCFYLIYSPFYQRSYVLGEILSRLALKRLLSTIGNDLTHPATQRTLSEMISTCSDQGVENTWQDFEKMAGAGELSNKKLLDEIVDCWAPVSGT